MARKIASGVLAQQCKRRVNESLPLWGLMIVLLFGTTTLLPSSLRFVVFALWLMMAGWMIGGILHARTQAHRMLFGSLAFLSAFGLALTGLLLVWEITVMTVSLVVVLLSLLATFCFDGSLPRFSNFEDGLAHAPSLPYLLIALFGETWLFVTLYGAWTADPLVSPWQLFNAAFFLVYAATMFAVIMFAATRRDRVSLALSILHFFVSLSVAVMVYGVGFGFDPFIHRAAEMAIVHDGAIEPRRLLYFGQYALVGGANLLTGVRVIFLDKWLVPVLAALLIPLATFFGLRDGWGLSDRSSRVFLHLALFFPAMYFVFTVPFNLTLLFLLLTCFLLPLVDSWRTRGVLVLLGTFALAIHPLGGIPLFLVLLFSFIGWIRETRIRRALLGLGAAFSILALPLLFALYNISVGQPPFVLQSSPFSRFISLFADPYLPWSLPIPFFVEGFYDAMRWVPRLFAVISLSFAWKYRSSMKVSVTPTVVLVLSLLGSLYLLSGFFSFADVIAYEQMEFAGRLLQTILLVTTPWILVFLAHVWKKRRSHTFTATSVLALLMTLFITATWYLSYPQLNLKVRDAGASVSSADVEVARFLESRYDGEPHLVLSHQMTSAAAVQESGFRHYLATDDGLALWYAIPTGGELYEYFLRLSTEGPTPTMIEEIRDFANVRHVYFVTYDSWPRAGFVRERAASFADASYGIQGTKLVIYEYQ